MDKKVFDTFKSPGVEWRGKPFWAWNGDLKKEELIRQVDVMKKMGFGGYFMHSRCGLLTEYLGDEWFELTNAVADAGTKAGMENWLYDEDRWPSGSAGGKATEEMEYREKSLVLYEMNPDAFEWTEDVVFAFAAKIGEDRISMGGYRELTRENANAAWAELEDCAGAAKVLAYKIEYDKPNGNYNDNTYLNTLSKEAVRHFLDVTHEEYAKRGEGRVGTTIRGIFTDETNRGQGMNLTREENGVVISPIFYTDDIFDEFSARYGYDIRPLMPEVFYRLNGESVSKVRIDYFDLGCDLFKERFGMQVNEWCEENNCTLTGHYLSEDSLCSQTAMLGSLMRMYPHMGIPGVDLLDGEPEDYRDRFYWIIQRCASVCRQLGKKWMLSELYGCTGWDFTLRGHKSVGDWQALFGVNLRCPHLSWYTMEGECKRDYPASVFYQSSYWKDYDYVESYFARFGVAMSQGKAASDVLVLEPIESMWALAHLRWTDWSVWAGTSCEDGLKLEADYVKTNAQLLSNRVLFDYGEEAIMAEHCRVADGKLYVGEASYNTFLVSGAITVRESTLNIMREMLDAGARVVFAGNVPEYVGGVKSNACRELLDAYENAVYMEISELGEKMAAFGTNPISSDACEAVFTQLRVEGDTYITGWINADYKNETGAFTITASLPREYRAEIWELETGERFVYPSEYRDGKHILNCSMPGAGSMILVFTKSQEELKPYCAKNMQITGELTDGAFAYELEEPNVMVLDYARYKFEGDEFSKLKEVLKVDQSIRNQLGLELRGAVMVQPWVLKLRNLEPYGMLTLEYPFRVETLPEGKCYFVGERPDENEYYLNGIRLNVHDENDWWVDNAFIKMEIPEGALKQGENVITLVTNFKRMTNIEATYIVGDFGVKAKAGASVMTAKAAAIGLNDIENADMPFYAADISIELTKDEYAPLVDRNAERIWMQLPEFGGALTSVECAGKREIVAWEPYMADVTEAVKNDLPIRITLTGTRRNCFGPLHVYPTKQRGHGPGTFVTEGDKWTDEYARVECKIGKIVFGK
ncbi:MAG: hypothetical protein E7335_03980 [Clostridiales bacterium]|nr:hypothetical protein [Clostridiales bacterium]